GGAFTGITACLPDIVSAISVGCEVAPRSRERSTQRPCATNWIEDLHLISGGVKITTQHIHQVTEVDRSGIACCVGYVGIGGDGISRWVIDKCVVRIGENATGDINATSCVD